MPLPSHLTIEIVTPDRAILHETVDEARLPGAEGYLGVLPGHTPLLVSLQVGEIWFRRGSEKTYLHAAFGFAEILPDRIRIWRGRRSAPTRLTSSVPSRQRAAHGSGSRRQPAMSTSSGRG